MPQPGRQAREKEQYGGIKLGSAFFGWLTATGTAVLLTALAAGTAVGAASTTDVGEAADQAATDLSTVGLVGGNILLVVLIVVAVLAAVAGDQFNVPAQLNSFPRIPLNEGDLTTGAIVTLLVVAAASLAGAILGGMAGMRFHRKVDRAGLGR